MPLFPRQIPTARPLRSPRLKAAVATLSLLALAACGGGSGGSDAGTQGTLRLALTDAPACGYDHVWVTVDRVRVHRSVDATDAEGGWSEIALAAPRRIDLLTLTNGALEELGQTALPAGRYQQLRLVLAPNDATSPTANAVLPTGGTEVALDTPSGVQSGLKMNADIEVAPGQVADFLIDFDACKSVVARGNSGRYNLKPVLRVLPRLAEAGARIVGTLHPSMAGATVSAQLAGVPAVSTTPDPATGRFELYPVPAGAYSVVIAGGGFATGVITGVPVNVDRYTFLNANTAPILLPSGADRSVDVEVDTTAGVSPDSALLRLRQALTSAGTVEVLARPVAPNSDPLPLTIASAAPQVAPFVDGAAAPVFAADTAPAVVGRYSAELTLTQPAPAPMLVKTAPVDVSAALPDPLPPIAVTFP
ncbi:MAG: DUF4382 domain-containing protein [Rubrivivax sp.]